jgi:hypothetical protein
LLARSHWRSFSILAGAQSEQLLVTLIVPPIVGMVTYIVVRHIWERDENASGDGVYALNQSDGTVVFGDEI